MTLLDTDILSYLVRRQPMTLQAAERYLLQHGALQLSIISYYKSLSGLLYKDGRQQID